MPDFSDRRLTRLQRKVRELESQVIFLTVAATKAEAEILEAKRSGNIPQLKRAQTELTKARDAKAKTQVELQTQRRELAKFLK